MEREAVVAEVAGDRARVVADRPSFCGACKAQGACGAQLLDRGRGRQGVWVDNAVGARPGEAVLVGIGPGALLGAAATAYLLPLAGLIGGVVAADAALAASTPATAGAAAGGLGLGLLAARTVTRRWRGLHRLRIERRASPDVPATPSPSNKKG
nr:SoxR reducing system RseC family protein [Halorhodospira neutriphila]